MATVYEQNFEGLNNGDLVGQDDWIDINEGEYFDVQTSVKYAGSKAVGISSPYTTQDVSHQIKRIVSGEVAVGMVQVSVYCNALPGTYSAFRINLRTNNNKNYTIGFGGGTNFANKIVYGADSWPNWKTINASASTWYTFQVEFDASKKSWRMRYKTGTGEYGSWTDWEANADSWTSFNNIQADVNNYSGGGPYYFDDILITSTVAPSSIKTILGLAKASVKTVNGLAIASVKSVNGLE